MKKILFVLFNVVLFSSLIILGYMIYIKKDESDSLKKKIDEVSNLNSKIEEIEDRNSNIINNLTGIEKEFNDKKNEYEELSKKNTELNDSINNCNSEIAKYDKMISDIQYKIDNYNNR